MAHHVLALEVLRGDGAPAGQRVAGVEAGIEGLLQKIVEDQVRVPVRGGAEDQVQLVLLQHILKGVGHAVVDAHIGPGKGPLENLEKGREDIGLDRPDAAQPQHLPLLQSGPDPLVQLQKRLPGIGEEQLSLPGQPDAPALLIEEGEAQIIFQVLHGLGESGLGDPQLFRGLAVVEGLGQL